MKKTLVEKIKSRYTNESQIKNLEMGSGEDLITIFYIESLVNKTLFSASILSPLQKHLKNIEKKAQKNNFEQIKTEILSIYSITESKNVTSILKDILNGFRQSQ